MNECTDLVSRSFESYFAVLQVDDLKINRKCENFVTMDTFLLNLANLGLLEFGQSEQEF
jgi:hypothetical protein